MLPDGNGRPGKRGEKGINIFTLRMTKAPDRNGENFIDKIWPEKIKEGLFQGGKRLPEGRPDKFQPDTERVAS
jgi:hypothetical protein